MQYSYIFSYNAYMDFLQQVFEGYSREDQIPRIREKTILAPLEEFTITMRNNQTRNSYTAKRFLNYEEKQHVFGTSV